MKNELDCYYNLKSEYREIYRQMDVGYLLYKSMFPIYLNSSAIDILELCNGTNKGRKIVHTISKINNMSVKSVKKDVLQFLRYCEQSNIVDRFEEERTYDIGIDVYGSKNIWIPYALCIELTQKCPLRCIHCYVSAGKGETMKTDILDSIVDSILILRIPCVQLTGGEPLLHPKFEKIFEKLVNNKIRVTITTSGYYYTDTIIDSLKRIREINSYVQVSIDGLSDVHSKIRGKKDAFEKSMSFIKLLMREKIPIVVATCWINQTYEEIEKLCLYLKQEGINTLRMSMVDNVGRAKDNCMSLKAKEIKLRIEKIKELQKQFNDCNFNIFLDECGSLDEKYFKNCGMGYNMYKIDPKGNIYECLFSTDIIGSIKNNYKFEDYLEDNKGIILKRTKRIAPNKTQCGQCENLIICNGCIKKAACEANLK